MNIKTRERERKYSMQTNAEFKYMPKKKKKIIQLLNFEERKTYF